MREILFRGKCINTGNWVHGCLVNNMFTYSEYSAFKKGEKVCEIITGDYESDNWEEAIQEKNNLIRVIPESVGQFTGLTDKNGTKIFEGDILEVTYYNHSFKNTKLIQEVYYLQESGCFCVRTVGKIADDIEKNRNNVPLHWTSQPNTVTLIGNVHDNPELLK